MDKISVEKSEWNIAPGRNKSAWNDNIKIYLEK
jgi:hypothetical protein